MFRLFGINDPIAKERVVDLLTAELGSGRAFSMLKPEDYVNLTDDLSSFQYSQRLIPIVTQVGEYFESNYSRFSPEERNEMAAVLLIYLVFD